MTRTQRSTTLFFRGALNFFLLGVGVYVMAFAVLTGGFDRCTTMPGGLKFGEYTTSKVLVCGFKVPT